MRTRSWLEGVFRGSQAKACFPRRFWRDLRIVTVGSGRILGLGLPLEFPSKVGNKCTGVLKRH